MATSSSGDAFFYQLYSEYLRKMRASAFTPVYTTGGSGVSGLSFGGGGGANTAGGFAQATTQQPIINSNQTNTGMSDYLSPSDACQLVKSNKVKLPALVSCNIGGIDIEEGVLTTFERDGEMMYLLCQDEVSGENYGLPLEGKKYNFFLGWTVFDYFNFSNNKPISNFKFLEYDNTGKPIKPKRPAAELDLTYFDKVVMHADSKEQIISVLKQHKNYSKIFEEWGLGETIEYGKGMTFLFWGSPGTGKTWAANMIAKSLGKEIMVLTAAEIQSSEPGQANRNIQQAFKAAGKNKVLFLDECDSLIGMRSQMGMIMAGEINSLLTEIEKFEGVLILATNRIGTLDEALERRISLIVEFPNPNYEQRLDIWKKMIPSKLPLHKKVDVEKLAEYKLSGGQIKNVLLGAARKAVADELTEVKQEHFISSIEHLQKSSALMGTEDRTIQVKVDHGKTEGTLTKTRSVDVAVDKVMDVEVGKVKDLKPSKV